MANYTIKKTTALEKESAKTIEIEIGVDEMEKYRMRSIKVLSERADLPGFRKGHVPEKIILEIQRWSISRAEVMTVVG